MFAYLIQQGTDRASAQYFTITKCLLDGLATALCIHYYSTMVFKFAKIYRIALGI